MHHWQNRSIVVKMTPLHALRLCANRVVSQPCCQSTVLLVNQLDESHFGCVTAAGSELVDLGVTTVAICVLGSDLVEELLDNVFLGDISESSTAGS